MICLHRKYGMVCMLRYNQISYVLEVLSPLIIFYLIGLLNLLWSYVKKEFLKIIIMYVIIYYYAWQSQFIVILCPLNELAVMLSEGLLYGQAATVVWWKCGMVGGQSGTVYL